MAAVWKPGMLTYLRKSVAGNCFTKGIRKRLCDCRLPLRLAYIWNLTGVTPLSAVALGDWSQVQNLVEIHVYGRHLACGYRSKAPMDHLPLDGSQDPGYEGRKEQSGFFAASQRVISEQHPADIACDGSHDDLLPILVIGPQTQHQRWAMFQAGLIEWRFLTACQFWVAGSLAQVLRVQLSRDTLADPWMAQSGCWGR